MDSLKVGLKILELNDRLGKLTDEMIEIRKELVILTDNLIDDAKEEARLNKGGK